MTTFLAKPIAKSPSPTARLSQLKRYVFASRNCGIISLWWMIGPAMRCGKNVMNSRKSPRSYSHTTPRRTSTRYAICVNVKKEMPSGSTICPMSQCVPKAAFTLCTKKLAYLK